MSAARTHPQRFTFALPPLLDWPVLWGSLGFFVTAVAAMSSFGINPPFWFANAIGVVALLKSRLNVWPALLVVLYGTDVLAVQLMVGHAAMIVGVCDTMEILVAASIIRALGGHHTPLFSGWKLGWLLLASVVAPLPSSVTGATVQSMVENAEFWLAWKTWYSASALGLVTGVPFLLVWTSRDIRHQELGLSRTIDLIGMSFALATIAVVLFAQNNVEYLFALFPTLLALTSFTGILGASSSGLLITGIGSWFAIRGEGVFAPSTELAGLVQERVFSLQSFSAAAILCAVPTAVVLTQLRQAKVRAERAAAAKSTFLATMSHEIRTPLNGVLGVAGVLGQSYNSPAQREMVKIITDSAKGLERILTDVLDTARIEAGHLEVREQPYRLAQAVNHAAALFRPTAELKGLGFEVSLAPSLDVTVLGDAARLTQILNNLLNNAAKFTSEGEVGLTVTEQNGWLEFEVRDTGIGFDPEAAAGLFKRFAQADETIAAQFGGTGLGLAISQGLAEAMGGSITATSQPGVGSSFILRIPFKVADLALVDDCSPETNDTPVLGGALHVLVADDNPTNLRVVELILGASDVQVSTAANGAEAVEAFKAQPYDLILMDLQMPVMDGLSAVRSIRAIENESGGGRVPILVLSANDLPQHHVASLEAGADGHVGKPIMAADLFAAMAKALEPNLAKSDAAESRLAAG